MPDGRVGRYQVERTLAERAGELWLLARDPDLGGALCVLQRVARSLNAEPFAYADFLERARTQKTFLHPNLVRALDVGTAGDDLLAVYEYVPGWSLETVVELCATRRHPLPLGFGCAALVEALRGLEAAHRSREGRPLVHGGLDLSEIRVQLEGPTKVKGFARVRAQARGRYRSPEELREEPLTPQSDVFSVGVMLHELLTGKPLFVELGEAVSGAALLYAPIPNPKDLNPSIPEALADLVMLATARERNRTVLSAGDFSRRLEAAAEPIALSRAQRTEWASWLKGLETAPEIEAPRSFARLAPPPTPMRPETITAPSLPAADNRAFWRAVSVLLLGAAMCIAAYVAYAELRAPPPNFKRLPPEPSGMSRGAHPIPNLLSPSSGSAPTTVPEVKGSVTLITQPVAEVRFRGQLLGVTPLAQAQLPIGVQTLEFTLPNGQRKRVNVEVTEGKSKGYRLDLSGP